MAQGALTYRDKVSQLISWGHWFCLGNIVVSLLISMRYLTIAHWPDTHLGQVYMFISWLGQFSFLPFVVFLLSLFPLSFLLPSNRTMRFLGAIIATVGISALAIDTQIFARFYVHLNPMLWQLLIDKENNRRGTDFNLMFILVPVIFFMELLLARLCWVSLRRLEQRKIGKPIAIVFLACFFLTHVIHVWADATVYRPITAQKINYPLFYPMTARSLLNSYGLIDIKRLREKSKQAGLHNGNPLNYPERPLQYKNQNGTPYNLLIIMAEGVRSDSLNSKLMPNTWNFADQSLRFTHHFSGSNNHTLGVYSLFYGLPTSYWKSIQGAHISPVMMDALRQRNYRTALFSSNGFHDQQLKDTVWAHVSQETFNPGITSNTKLDDQTIVENWQQWQQQHSANAPWFNYIDLNGVVNLDGPSQIAPKSLNDRQQWLPIYQHAVEQVDKKIQIILEQLRQDKQLSHTIVIITSDHGQEFADMGSDHWGYGNNFSRFQTQVPLVIYWPNKEPEVINQDTSHLDISATIDTHLLGIRNRSSDYTTGRDLFKPSRKWILIGDSDEQAIYQKNQITLLTSDGNYEMRNRNYRRVHIKANMPIILQVLNELRRFYRDDS
ncbi:MAG: Inner membrane protein YejM [Candidatus Celerinatantimonas neptuna]|nr:MAG: Inner membrane protein YejM [Candidatus Celerinatantimonas neptuna]